MALTVVALVWRGARLAGARPSLPAIAVGAIALAWCGFSLIEAWNSPHGFLRRPSAALFPGGRHAVAEKTD